MSKNILNTLSRTAHKVGFKLRKHSPEILMGVGIIGTGVSMVMACKATTKLEGIMEESKAKIDDIHGAMEHPETLPQPYTQEDGKKDLTIVYTQTGLELVKLYGPAVVTATLSVTCMVASHVILRKRNVALAAAYTAVNKTFKEYRGRVIERFGKELDHELRYNIKAKTFEETTVDEKGNETTVEKTAEVATVEYSDYAKFYDDGCKGWDKDPENNLRFLKMQQAYANDKLQRQGYLFLNDVYEMLGIPKTKMGQVVGWIYNEKEPVGDNYVDFGIYDTTRETCRNFVNGYERTILLDFNVDGNILDMM